MQKTDCIKPTTIIRPDKLRQLLGLDLTIASETFQTTGSFKFRAAYNLASKVEQKMLIAASSGNFGQALALACKLLGKSCIIVMPDNSAQVKIKAVKDYGGKVELVDTNKISRMEKVRQLSSEFPEAYISSAYDHPLIIEGNASLGLELANMQETFDVIAVPVGGGGLISGIAAAFAEGNKKIPTIIGAEPLLANDAARSLASGKIVGNDKEAATLADGAKTLQVGNHNWQYIKEYVTKIIEVSEEKILEALWLLFSLANLKAEPTGALSLGAVLADKNSFAGKKVVIVVSGGNVDTLSYCKLLEQASRQWQS
jgi:threo-3-hydroxy-L-aspartate ammonia-lyase